MQCDGEQPDVICCWSDEWFHISAEKHKRHGKCTGYACHDRILHIFFYRCRKKDQLKQYKNQQKARCNSAYIADAFGIAL